MMYHTYGSCVPTHTRLDPMHMWACDFAFFFKMKCLAYSLCVTLCVPCMLVSSLALARFSFAFSFARVHASARTLSLSHAVMLLLPHVLEYTLSAFKDVRKNERDRKWRTDACCAPRTYFNTSKYTLRA